MRILIGNGPSALKNKCGKIIDQCSTVIRFNNFHIDGYEEYVGTKTDIWVVTIGYLFRKDIHWKMSTPQPKTIIFIPYSITEYENYAECLKVPLKDNEEMCDINISKWADQYYNPQSHKWLSTGIMAIMQFKPCYIIGFDNFLSTKHHYGDSGNLTQHHNGQLEANLLQSLIQTNQVYRL